MRNLQTKLLGSLVLLAGSQCVIAQPSAKILGRVTDATGAAVQDAKVTAVNTATGLERETVTNASGDYEFPLLPITGRYDLSISKTGFQTYQLSGIELQVDQQARYDVALTVGNISERVSVTAEAPIVNTEIGQIGQVIPNRTIVDLPLNGRNFVQLATLLPDTVRGPDGQQTGNTTIAVSGGRYGKTEFLLDGVSDSDQLFDGVTVTPSVDAIQEFKVQQNSFSAEYGRGDAVVLATIKGGTNEFHGTVFEFLRNDKLDSRNFFARSKDPYRQNQFGASTGGPILRDRTFFFLNYEGTRIRRGLTFNSVVPSPAFAQGNFSSVSTQIRDPLTGDPFPGNVVPSNRINPATAFFLQFYPAPNTPQGTFVYSAPLSSDVDQGNMRIDQRIGSRDSLFGRYSINNLDRFNPGNFPRQGGFTQGLRSQNAVLTETHLFTPTTLNELRLGYTRMKNSNIPEGLGNNYTSQAGIGGFEQTSLNFPGFPNISISGFTGINGRTFQPIINPTNMYEIIDNLSLIRGRHTIKTGADLRKYDLSSTNAAFSRGSFSFNGTYSGNPFADYLLGYPSSGTRSFPRNFFGMYETRYHFYVQDDFKVTPNLTLNLGLRYELNIQPTPKLGQAADFDFFGTGKWIVATYKGSINLTTQQVAQYAYPVYKDQIITTQQAGLPNKLFFNDYNDFAPRVGFAWRPFGNNRTVIRGGYGIFYLLTSGNNIVSAPIINVPFILDESKLQPTVNGRPTLQIQNFFPPFSTSASFSTPLTYGVNPHMRTPYLHEWNFAVQHEIVPNLSLEIAYVANKGTHLEEALPQNLAPPSATDLRPFQQRRPRPDLGTGQFYDNSGNSNYNALDVRLEKRFSRGVYFLLGYVWGKAIDIGSSDQGGNGADNPFNLRTMRGPSDLDVTHRFVGSFGVEVPVGRGRAFGANMPRVADLIIGGWQVSGIATFQSGMPFTPTISSDPANVGFTYGRRPDVKGTGHVDNPGPNLWFNPKDFPLPAPYTIGNAGRNILRGPGVNNWDLSILKNFHFTERIYLQFRTELFNAFNHTQFNNPVSMVDVPTAGQILSARDPRIMQFGMKLYF
jgi:hypothetical protein